MAENENVESRSRRDAESDAIIARQGYSGDSVQELLQWSQSAPSHPAPQPYYHEGELQAQEAYRAMLRQEEERLKNRTGSDFWERVAYAAPPSIGIEPIEYRDDADPLLIQVDQLLVALIASGSILLQGVLGGEVQVVLDKVRAKIRKPVSASTSPAETKKVPGVIEVPGSVHKPKKNN